MASYERRSETHGRILTVDHTTSTAHRLEQYDGACSRLHGHNLRWDVVVHIGTPTMELGMVVDLKDIKDCLDRVDHKVVLDEADPLADDLPESHVYTVSGAPTCERLSSIMARELCGLNGVGAADVKLYETEKYGVRAVAPEGTDLR